MNNCNFFLSCILCLLVGCSSAQPSDSKLTIAEARDEIWTVVADGDFDGVSLLLMEHGDDWASETYGLKIQSGSKLSYLVWQGPPVSPFELQTGDRFRFASGIEESLYDSENACYYAEAKDIDMVSQNTANNG